MTTNEVPQRSRRSFHRCGFEPRKSAVHYDDYMEAPGLGPPPSISRLDRHFLDERARIERLARIRQMIFGSMDGLLVPLGVISGVAGGTGDPKAVIVAGVAEAFAGALSMGAGEFISGRAEAQVHEREMHSELTKMRGRPGCGRWGM